MQVSPLITVIITCYNHGKYLREAIESVLNQSFPNIEIVVVDDGSTDHTKFVIDKYPQVKYIYQGNQGVSSARNTGVIHSKGEFICFLDADDWLLPEGLEINFRKISENKELAFVSGAYVFVTIHHPFARVVSPERLSKEERYTVNEPKFPITQDHYKHFLRGNYIGMHAAVLYRRWVFEEFKFDPGLTGCEDYDLFLRISRKYPVLDHAASIAAYRLHANNTTANTSMMLHFALQVLERQKNYIKTSDEEKCLNEGKVNWKKLYTNVVYQKMLDPLYQYKREDFQFLWLNDKKLYFNRYINKFFKLSFKGILKKILPSPLVGVLRNLKGEKIDTPPVGQVNMGDLARLDPFSRAFGYDRGGPVDRYYIENFLEKSSHLIKGRVLEIGDNEYTLRFGGSKITRSDILHINETNPNATFIGDLTNAPVLPDNSFDCIVLTQTLHLIYDYRAAIKTCFRILKPGGSLLLTVPGITSIDEGEWKSTWYWAFTDISIKRVLEETFEVKNVNVEAFGNILTTTAFLYGMGLEEVSKDKLDYFDPSYQVTITAIATKA
jgi:glycosyltransferase involved in cell wall biosynthesis